MAVGGSIGRATVGVQEIRVRARGRSFACSALVQRVQAVKDRWPVHALELCQKVLQGCNVLARCAYKKMPAWPAYQLNGFSRRLV